METKLLLTPKTENPRILIQQISTYLLLQAKLKILSKTASIVCIWRNGLPRFVSCDNILWWLGVSAKGIMASVSICLAPSSAVARLFCRLQTAAHGATQTARDSNRRAASARLRLRAGCPCSLHCATRWSSWSYSKVNSPTAIRGALISKLWVMGLSVESAQWTSCSVALPGPSARPWHQPGTPGRCVSPWYAWCSPALS